MPADTSATPGAATSDSFKPLSGSLSSHIVNCTECVEYSEKHPHADRVLDDAAPHRPRRLRATFARGYRNALDFIHTLIARRRKLASRAQPSITSTVAPAIHQGTSPSAQGSTPIATSAAPGPLDILHTPGTAAKSSTDCPGPPKPDHTSRVSLSASHPSANQKKSIFLADAPIEVYLGPGVKLDDARRGMVLYDTGCKFNLISTSYLAERRKPEGIAHKRTYAMSITGELFSHQGTARIRWQDDNFTSLRYMNAQCLIVDSDFFDVIIGSETIEDQNLYVRNPKLVGPVLAIAPRVDDSQVAKAERIRNAKAKRDKELQDQEEEERRREQIQASGS